LVRCSGPWCSTSHRGGCEAVAERGAWRYLIVAKDISDALRYAVSIILDVQLFEYEVKFSLRPADGLPAKADVPGQV